MPQPPQSRSHWLAVATVLGGGTVCCCLSPVFRRALQLSLFLGALVAFPFLASFSIARARQQPKTSDGSASPTATKARRKRLKFSTPAAFDSLSRKQAWEREAAGSAGRRTESLHPSLPASVNSAVDRLLAQILSHFLLSWWTPLTSPLAPPTFPNAVESTIRTTLSNVLRRVEEVDWPSLVVAQVLPLTTSHITRFKQAGGLSASASDPSSSSAAAEDLLLSQAYAALLDQGKLHPAVNVASANTRPSEERFLQDLIGRILPLVLPSEEAKSPAVVTIVRELVASTILLPVVDMVCDADFWNVLIDTKIQAAINEREQVAALRAALDNASQVPIHYTQRRRSNIDQHNGGHRPVVISAATSTKDFDSFLRSIRRCSSLVEARRLRNDILLSIRRIERARDSSLSAHVERLHEALRKIDARIAALGGASMVSGEVQQDVQQHQQQSPDMSLSDILRHAIALSFWMEFMERRRRLALVQFWLTIEGLRDPLDDNADQSAPEVVQAAQDDATLLYSSFFTDSNTAIVPETCSYRHVQTLRGFALLDDSRSMQSTGLDVQHVRSAIHALQQEVFEDMESQDYPPFVASSLFDKMSAAITQTAPPTDHAARANPHTPRQQERELPKRPQIPSPSSAASLSFFKATADVAASSYSSIPSLLQPAKLLSLRRTDTAPPRVVSTTAVVEPSSAAAPSDAPWNKYEESALQRAPDLPTPTMPSSPQLPSGASNFAFVMGLGEEEISRAPLFGESSTTPGLEESTASDSFDFDDDRVQVQRMQAIQDALSSIVEDAEKESDSKSSLSRTSSSSQAAAELQRAVSATHIAPLPSQPPRDTDARAQERRTASMPDQPTQSTSTAASGQGTTSLPTRAKLFDDDDDPEITDEAANEQVSRATTLRERISHENFVGSSSPDQLRRRIVRLSDQEEVLRGLIRRADVIGNERELKILTRSLESVSLEKQTLQFNLRQNGHHVQLSPELTSVCISNTTHGGAEGKEFILYLVSVQQQAPPDAEIDQSTSGWFVARRYSEFFDLHTALRERFPITRHFDFPSKRLVTFSSPSLVAQRRIALERYLQALVKDPETCNSSELRAFLSQENVTLPSHTGPRPAMDVLPGQSFIRNVYRSVAVGLDELTAGPTMFESMAQRLAQHASDLSSYGLSLPQQEDLMRGYAASSQAAPSSPSLGSAQEGPEGFSEGLTYFTAPICDLFIEVFELKDRSQWLRRQAILIVLQQVLGGTIERKFREGFSQTKTEDSLQSLLSTVSNILFPDGKPRTPSPARTAAEKDLARHSASRRLATFLPDAASNVTGRQSARQASRTLFAVLQNKRLLKHLVYTILERILARVFPEAFVHQTKPNEPV